MFAVEPEGNVLKWYRVGGPYQPGGLPAIGEPWESKRKVCSCRFLEDLVVGANQIDFSMGRAEEEEAKITRKCSCAQRVRIKPTKTILGRWLIGYVQRI